MAERTIFLKGDWEPYKEGIAGGAITPGQTIVLGSAGTYTVGPVAAAAPADNTLLVAREYDLQNYPGGTNRTIDTAYASQDRVLFAAAKPGNEFYALVAANAAAIVKGDRLEYNSGFLRKATTGVVKAIALEAVDNSAGGTPARIIVEAV